jgi:hypothetical protein
MTRAENRRKRSRLKGARSRGITIIIVMFIAIVVFILIGSMLEVMTMEAQAKGASADSYAALTSAYSGVDAEILAIEEFYVGGTAQGDPPDVGTVTIPDQSDPQRQTGYTTQITATYSAYGTGLKYFLITSTGFIQDDASGPTNVHLQRQVSALVRQVPFSKFSQYTETEKSNTGNTVWYSNPQNYQGLVYSGGPMHIRYTPGSTPPIFSEGFQTASNPWWFNTATGQQGYKYGPTGAGLSSVYGPSSQGTIVSPLDLPGLSQNLIVFSEALNGNASSNDLPDFQRETNGLAPGVYLNGQLPSGSSGGQPSLDTGLFVQGDADVTATAAGNTETFTFSGADGTGEGFPATIVTIDFNADTTTVTEGGSAPVTYMGVPSGEAGGSSDGNGAIFDNGSLTIEDGSVIHGQYTIALPDPPTNGQDLMTLTGSVTYQTEPDPQNGVLSNDELALWANDIYLTDTSNANPRIDGMILTGFVNECQSGSCRDGSFYNSLCGQTHCGGASGDITLFGSIIENIRGELGLLGPNGTVAGGFLRTAIYDSRLGSTPPPFSPTTNEYFIVALTDDGAL